MRDLTREELETGVGDPADRQIAIICSDVTDRRNAQERLLISEAVARQNVERVQLALAAGAIIGTWHWDLRSDRFTVDEAFARAFGLAPALGLEGMSLAQVIESVHPEDREGLTTAINTAIANGSAYAHQYRVLRADGKYYWIEANGRVDLADDGSPLSLPGVLIDAEGRQTLDPRPTDVNLLMEGMGELIQRTVGPSITVETLGATGVWPTRVDASQLENALLNVCINARDAMPDGGRISIATANVPMDHETARGFEMTEGEYLCLTVTDTGTGMTPDVIAKAFDPFFTTKPIGQGTGLGLSMIYGFARQSGGQARICSQVGRGTSIRIYLPRYDGDAVENAREPRATAAAPIESGETLLIVDDEPSVRLLLMDVLSGLGYSLIEASDSIAGPNVLRSDVHIDLLITDVGLPGGMNGRQMADAGREVRPGLKTLFITGYAENAIMGDTSLGDGMEVLTKPFAIDTLATRVRELIGC